MKRVFNNANTKWITVFQLFIPDIDIIDLFKSRCHIDINQYDIPLFYQDIIIAWKQFRDYEHPEKLIHICNEFLWFNPFIKIGGKSAFYKHWYKISLETLEDCMYVRALFSPSYCRSEVDW